MLATAEVRRMLTAPPHRHTRDWMTRPEECAVGILLLAPSRYHFLHDDLSDGMISVARRKAATSSARLSARHAFT